MKRYRKVMGLAIVLVALAVAINALAFKTASVTNSATLTVAATQGSALGIDVGTAPGSGFGTDFASNYLKLTIADKMQPNSTYTFNDVFKIKHGASEASTAITGIDYLTNLPASVGTIRLMVGATELGDTGANSLANSSATMDVDLEITIKDTAALGAQTFSITITGNQ